MLEEDAVPAADCCFPVAFRIKSEADTGSGIEQVTLHTAHVGIPPNRGVRKSGCRDRPPCAATLHHAIERIAASIQRSRLGGVGAVGIIHQGRIRRVPRRWIKIERPMVTLAISPEEAEPYSQIQGQPPGRMEVILEIRFQDFIAVVILGLGAGLGEVGDVAQEKIGKRIAGRTRCGAAEGQEAVDRRVGPGKLILLCRGKISAKLQIVSACDLGDVVTVGIGRIRVVRSVRDVSIIFGNAVVDAAAQVNSRQLASGVHLREKISTSVAPALPGIWVGESRTGENDMVGGVAKHELIEQRGRCSGGEARYQRGRRANEIRLNGRETCSIRPQRHWSYGRPRVVGITKHQTQFIAQIVVDANQFFPPISGLHRGSRVNIRSVIWRRDQAQKWHRVGVDWNSGRVDDIGTVRTWAEICEVAEAGGAVCSLATFRQGWNYNIEGLSRNAIAAPFL